MIFGKGKGRVYALLTPMLFIWRLLINIFSVGYID
jgi:hypothetical protein